MSRTVTVTLREQGNLQSIVRPEAPVPRQKRPRPLTVIWALRDNPITAFSQEGYEAPFLEFGRRRPRHKPALNASLLARDLPAERISLVALGHLHRRRRLRGASLSSARTDYPLARHAGHRFQSRGAPNRAGCDVGRQGKSLRLWSLCDPACPTWELRGH